jgi:Zn finger protein HypA/HybF involved in hydrogenase expression
MNENDKRVYKPAPQPGQMKCPRCGKEMQPSGKDPKVSVCPCGFKATRIRM